MKRACYEVLDINRNFDEVSIKKTYHNITMEYHLDINPGNAEAIEWMRSEKNNNF